MGVQKLVFILYFEGEKTIHTGQTPLCTSTVASYGIEKLGKSVLFCEMICDICVCLLCYLISRYIPICVQCVCDLCSNVFSSGCVLCVLMYYKECE